MPTYRRRDYAENQQLDTYEQADIDDEEQEELTAAQRRKADLAIQRRNRQEQGKRGFRAAARSRAPDLLMDDEDEDEEGEDELLTGMRRRTRHQYDERIEDDDVAGIETVSRFKKAKSEERLTVV